jgi:hypothetical protein
MAQREKKPKTCTFKLTLDEINALLACVHNVDIGAMAEDYPNEEEGNVFVKSLDSAVEKLTKS